MDMNCINYDPTKRTNDFVTPETKLSNAQFVIHSLKACFTNNQILCFCSLMGTLTTVTGATFREMLQTEEMSMFISSMTHGELPLPLMKQMILDNKAVIAASRSLMNTNMPQAFSAKMANVPDVTLFSINMGSGLTMSIAANSVTAAAALANFFITPVTEAGKAGFGVSTRNSLANRGIVLPSVSCQQIVKDAQTYFTPESVLMVQQTFKVLMEMFNTYILDPEYIALVAVNAYVDALKASKVDSLTRQSAVIKDLLEHNVHELTHIKTKVTDKALAEVIEKVKNTDKPFEIVSGIHNDLRISVRNLDPIMDQNTRYRSKNLLAYATSVAIEACKGKTWYMDKINLFSGILRRVHNVRNSSASFAEVSTCIFNYLELTHDTVKFRDNFGRENLVDRTWVLDDLINKRNTIISMVRALNLATRRNINYIFFPLIFNDDVQFKSLLAKLMSFRTHFQIVFESPCFSHEPFTFCVMVRHNYTRLKDTLYLMGCKLQVGENKELFDDAGPLADPVVGDLNTVEARIVDPVQDYIGVNGDSSVAEPEYEDEYAKMVGCPLPAKPATVVLHTPYVNILPTATIFKEMVDTDFTYVDIPAWSEVSSGDEQEFDEINVSNVPILTSRTEVLLKTVDQAAHEKAVDNIMKFSDQVTKFTDENFKKIMRKWQWAMYFDKKLTTLPITNTNASILTDYVRYMGDPVQTVMMNELKRRIIGDRVRHSCFEGSISKNSMTIISNLLDGYYDPANVISAEPFVDVVRRNRNEYQATSWVYSESAKRRKNKASARNEDDFDFL